MAGRSEVDQLAQLAAERERLAEERAHLERELEETNRGVLALYSELDDRAERLRVAEEAAEARAVQWQSTFDSISDGVVLLDPEGSIVGLNRTAGALLGAPPDSCIGCRLRELIDLPELDDPRLHTSDRRIAFEATTGERWMRLRFDPMTRSDGRRDGTVVTVADITERKRVDLALKDALRRQREQSDALARASAAQAAFRQLLEAIVDEMPIGVMVVDAASGRMMISNAEVARIVRGPIEGPATLEEADALLGDPDGPAGGAAGSSALDRALGGEIVRDEEIEIVRGDGSHATISVSSIPIRGDDEAIVAAVATISDITRRREADTLRDAFIGVLSHELRTPITSIYGGSKVLLRDGVEARPEVRRTVLEDLVGESERLNRMVENLLVLARVERGVTLTGHEPVLLQRLLPRIVADEARLWPGLDLVLDVADDVPTVAGDESFIDQVLRNYLSNAGKYGPPSGTVRIDVGVRPEERDVRIAVRDEGDGIDEAEAARLFELFFRSSSVANKKAGSGIGLFVSRHLVEGMGGRVWAESRPEGGSEFGFSLPIYELA
jgi:PAS domain S-box-containing protein